MKTGVSYGTATLLGYNRSRCDCLPETAYLISGGACHRKCSFCSRWRDDLMLSRVSWPEYDMEDVVGRIRRIFEEGALKRACFQTVFEPGFAEKAMEKISMLRSSCPIPISVSAGVCGIRSIRGLFEAGASNVAIPADCASPSLFESVKKMSRKTLMDAIREAAAEFPGRITTHVIAGLGETEGEMAEFLLEMKGIGVRTGLFAFTPVPGSEMASRPSPQMRSYRRIQLAAWLARIGAEELFSVKEGIIAFDKKNILDLLDRSEDRGAAFRTSGCPGCNRPYYNERPGTTPFNYPRKLLPEEESAAIQSALSE